MSDAYASTPRLNSCTRIAHSPGPINHQPPCCGARPSGIMSKAEEGTIIPFKAADHSQGRSRVLDRGYANFGELRFHAAGYPGGEVLPASIYKQLAFGTPQGGRPSLEETRLPCCSRTDGRSAAQSVRSFVTKASPPSKERRCSPSRKPCPHRPPRYPSPARDSFPEEGGVTATESPENTEPVGNPACNHKEKTD